MARGCCSGAVLKGCACLGIVLLLLAGCGLVLGVAMQFIGQPDSIRTELTASISSLSTGDPLTVKITVENVDVHSVTITGIGLGKDLLGGASLETTDPRYRSVKKHNYPIYGKWDEYLIDQTLLGGEKLDITLTLKAIQPGTYSGDVTVWVKSNFYGISMAQARRERLEFTVK